MKTKIGIYAIFFLVLAAHVLAAEEQATLAYVFEASPQSEFTRTNNANLCMNGQGKRCIGLVFFDQIPEFNRISLELRVIDVFSGSPMGVDIYPLTGRPSRLTADTIKPFIPFGSDKVPATLDRNSPAAYSIDVTRIANRYGFALVPTSTQVNQKLISVASLNIQEAITECERQGITRNLAYRCSSTACTSNEYEYQYSCGALSTRKCCGEKPPQAAATEEMSRQTPSQELRASLISHAERSTVTVFAGTAFIVQGRGEPLDAVRGYRWEIFNRGGGRASLRDVGALSSAMQQVSDGTPLPVWFDYRPTLIFRRAGSYEVRFSVKDANEVWSEPALFYVEASNRVTAEYTSENPPVFSNAAPEFNERSFNGREAVHGQISGRPNAQITFTISASDPDNDVVTYGISGPENARIDRSTGVFSWTPSNTGTYSVEIRAFDGRDTASKSISIVVEEAAIAAPASQDTEDGSIEGVISPASQPLRAIITSHRDGRTVRIQRNDGITVHGRSEPADAAKGYRWAVFTSGNTPADPRDVINLNERIRQATTTTQTPKTVWFDRSPNLQFTRPGRYEVRFWARDTPLNAPASTPVHWSDPARFSVIVNSPPLFLGTAMNGQQAISSPLFFRANQPRTFSISAFDADGDTLSYALVGLPGATLNSATGEFSWTPSSAGRYEDVEIRASDGRESAVSRLIVIVEQSGAQSQQIEQTLPLIAQLTSLVNGARVTGSAGYMTPPITLRAADERRIAGTRVAVFKRNAEGVFRLAPLGSAENVRGDQSKVKQATNTAGQIIGPIWFDAWSNDGPVIKFNQPGEYELRMAIKGLDGVWSRAVVVTYIIS